MKKVIIYTVDGCPHCQDVKELLKEKKVKFTEKNISKNPKLAEEMIKKSGQMGVPVVNIEKDGKEDVIVGFDQAKLTQVLGI